MLTDFAALGAELARIRNRRRVGRVTSVGTAALEIAGLRTTPVSATRWRSASAAARERALGGEIVGVSESLTRAMTYAPLDGAAVGDEVVLLGAAGVHPAETWVGRIVDAFGQPLDGRPLAPGAASATLRRAPPPPATRKGLGRGSRPASRSSTPSSPSPAASASASSPAPASASPRSSATSPAASRPTSSSMPSSANAGASCATSSTTCSAPRACPAPSSSPPPRTRRR